MNTISSAVLLVSMGMVLAQSPQNSPKNDVELISNVPQPSSLIPPSAVGFANGVNGILRPVRPLNGPMERPQAIPTVGQSPTGSINPDGSKKPTKRGASYGWSGYGLGHGYGYGYGHNLYYDYWPYYGYGVNDYYPSHHYAYGYPYGYGYYGHYW